jgi:hypothetical protein
MSVYFLSDAPSVPGVKMVRWVSEIARVTQWACAAASTVSADRIGIDAPHDTEIKPRIAKARITRVTCKEERNKETTRKGLQLTLMSLLYFHYSVKYGFRKIYRVLLAEVWMGQSDFKFTRCLV